MSDPELSPTTFKHLLKKLIQSPDTFTPHDVAQCFRHLCLPSHAAAPHAGASEAQVGAFLTALTLSGIDADPEVVAACAAVLRDHAVQVGTLEEGSDQVQQGAWDYARTDGEGERYTGLVDVVGTGGDGHDAFNVSTTAAVVVAGTGVRVAKHGSKAATSSSGSADLLISLGCTLTFPPAELPTILARTPFLFLFAPHYHPALAHIAPIRRQLNFRTVFNVLGPLINPAKPGRMVLGVAKRELGDTFARVLQILNVDRAMVVCGKEGLDEISPEGETWVWSLDRGVIEESTIHPTRDFGLPTHKLTAVRGATPELNAQTFRALLQPGSPVPAHLAHPADPADSPSIEAIRDFVLINAAALLKTSGRAASYTEGVALARASLESGDAWRAFQAFVDASGDAMRSAGGDDGAVEPEDDGGVAARGGSVEAWLHHEQQKKKEAEGK
ncbi:anthranilate phosphoribosyltransferase [Naganishia albida]|nr:anthranilate phosphoribosyltransferase [Naganishia albida]